MKIIKTMKKTISTVILIIIVAVVGGGSFYSGIIYGKNQSTKSFNPQNFRIGQAGNRNGNGAGANFLTGDIIAKDDKSVTIKLRDGGSKIVFLSNSTKINKQTDGSLSDLEVGKTIMVEGKQNSDGSFSADTVQLNPRTGLPVESAQ